MFDWDEIQSTVAINATYFVSDVSVALILTAISAMDKRYKWRVGPGIAPSDIDWDEITDAVAQAQYEIMTPVQSYPIGGIAWVAVAQLEPGWLLCNGAVHNISDYPLLGAKLGAVYGGDGITTFGVPDLIDRFARGKATVAGTGGLDTVTLSESQIPSHAHTESVAQTQIAEIDVGVPIPLATSVSGITGYTGGGQAHENKPPYLDLYPVIKAYEVAIDTVAAAPSDSILIGTIVWWAAGLPDKYLHCGGGLVSTIDFPDLFALWGYLFGGSGYQFGLPDIGTRSIVGYKGGQAPFNNIGNTGGEIDHLLTTVEMPAHSHTIQFWSQSTGGLRIIPAKAGNPTATDPTSSVGGGQAHNNMPPYIVLRPIVRALP